MLNGKFFTGLPPNMVDRSKGLNRQQTNFFWPDDTLNQSPVETKIKRRTNVQAENKDAYIQRTDYSNSDAETKERFKKEFTKSSIQFYDNVEQSPSRRNRQKLTAPPQQKIQNVEPPVNTRSKQKETLSSKIEFYDYADDLNNIPRTDKNNKFDVERNSKNSPKLQNKQMAFDPPDEAINFIENNVRDMQLQAPPRRRNPIRENRPRVGRMKDDQQYSDFSEGYHSPRRLPLPPPPIRSRYPESDQDFDDYPRRRMARPTFFDNDYIDVNPRRQKSFNDEETMSNRKIGRQVHFGHSNRGAAVLDPSQDYPDMAQPTQQTTRKVNILKVDNDFKNNASRTIPSDSPPTPTSPPSHKHLTSNICFSDTESATTPTPPCPPKRNIRSSAVNRVSVGLPD